MKKLLAAVLFALSAVLISAGNAQVSPPKPSPERIKKVFEDDQLSAEKCGVPRNAGDDYMPAPAYPDQTRAPRVSGRQPFKVDVVASGLEHPFALAFLPSGKLLVSIRAGGLRTIDKAGKVSAPIAGAPATDNTIRVAGMNDVSLDRDFSKNRTLYMTYTAKADSGSGTIGRIVSAKLSADETALTDLKILKEGPFLPRRVTQASDGTLYALTADIFPGYKFAQSVASPQGKVLRLNADGTIPKDNPYLGDKTADPSVYAIGFRDAQGMAFEPKTGALWLNENEPRGGDELNLVKPGKNYGFPVISYGRDNDGTLLNNGKTVQDGMEQPIYYWTPSVAFSGMAFYTGKPLKGWQGSVFMGGLSGMQLVRLELKNGRVVGEEKLLRERCKRIRDVRQGPDGLLYLITDEANGEVLRISPAK